jgi:hypothetical protein
MMVIMELLKNIRSSIYGPAYYASLSGKPFSYSMKYFLLLAVLLTVVLSVVMLFSIVPNVRSFLMTASSKIVDYYPSELQVTISHGKVSTNVAEPYFLKLPAEFTAKVTTPPASSSAPENLLVIDTKDPFTVDEFRNDHTLLLLMGDSFAYVRDQSKQDIDIQPLGQNFSMVFNKGTVASFVQRMRSYFWIIYAGTIVLVPIGVFIGMMVRLIYLFLFAVLVWAFMRMRKMNGGYKKAYRLGLHLMTTPLIIGVFCSIFIPAENIPFLFTAIALIMMVVNVRSVPPPISAL